MGWDKAVALAVAGALGWPLLAAPVHAASTAAPSAAGADMAAAAQRLDHVALPPGATLKAVHVAWNATPGAAAGRDVPPAPSCTVRAAIKEGVTVSATSSDCTTAVKIVAAQVRSVAVQGAR